MEDKFHPGTLSQESGLRYLTFVPNTKAFAFQVPVAMTCSVVN